MQSTDNNNYNDNNNNNMLFRNERVAAAPSLRQRAKRSSASRSPYRTVRICGSLPETVELQRSLQSRTAFAESVFEIVHIDSDDLREKREKVDVAFVTARNHSVQGFPYVQFLKSLAFACSNARRVMVVSFSRSSPSLCPCDLSGCVLSAQWEFPSIRVQLLSVTMDGDWSDCRERLAEEIDLTLGERDTRAYASVSLSSRHTSERALTRLSAPVSISSLFPTHTDIDTEKSLSSLSSQFFADNDIAVVTGGRGGLGFLAARALLLCGAKHVVLWSRSLPTDSLPHLPTDMDALNALEDFAKERDASLLFVACDVSVSEQVHLAFEDTVKECEIALRKRQEKRGAPQTLSAPLRVTCVVHSAGVLRDSLLTQHAALYASDVWAGKVTGCANLCLSLPPSVHTLVAFSSIVAVTGNIGQSAYALANAAMETLLSQAAHTRNTTLSHSSQKAHIPLRCVSVRWPGVRGVGMGRLFSHTEHSLTVDKDCVKETLVWLFSHIESENSFTPQVFTVLPHTLAHALRESPLLREKLVVDNAVSEKKKETERESDGETESESERESEHTSTEEPPLDRESVLCALREIALSLLTDCVASERELENTPLLSLGMDSFAAAELALSVGELYERDLSPTLIYSHPSLSAIADLLCVHKEKKETKKEKRKRKKEESESEGETEESDVERESTEDELTETQLFVCPLLALHTERVKHTTTDPTQQTQTKRVEGESSTKTHNGHTATNTRTHKHAHAEREDVVVVGLSLDFPGDCRSLCDLDKLLQTRRQTVSTSPWDALELASSLMGGTNAHTEKETQAHRKEKQQRTTPSPTQSERDAAQRVRAGHYLSDEQFSFDPSLFRISAAEAQHMHPTHKLLLNNVHRALCDSDLLGEKRVKNTGVFVGIGGQAESYNVCAVTPRVQQRERGRERAEKDMRETETRTQTQTVDLSRLGLPVKHSSASLSHNATDSLSPAVSLSAYSATANTTSVAAGRISFAFDFTGPCLAIDTACSSSLVALHAARRALQLRECDVAIVAGVNVLDATTSLSCAVGGMLASDAICRTFDANAKGYGRGEGCAVIVLKRESDVLSHERVYCKVRGSAVMQDGLSASLTAPNARSQQQVVAAALADAGLSPRDLSLVEAHGTGTQFGDPVEIAALAEVFGSRENKNSDASVDASSAPAVVPVTAVKASLGHLEPAAGLAGICSALLSMERGCSAPNAQLRRLNPLLARSLANSPLVIAAEPLPLDNGERDKTLFSGVSSFGYSGTIAHVVLERVKREKSKVSVCLWRKSEMENNTHTVIRSGRTSLDEVFGNFAECFPSVATDAAAAERDDPHEKESLSAFEEIIGDESETHSVFFDEEEQVDDADCESSSIEETALSLEGMLWQFSGQGSLKVGSARAVFESSDRFREHLSHCDAVLQREIGLTATELLYPPVLGLSPSLYFTSSISPASKSLSLTEAEKRLLKAMYTQPALVALEYALAATVRESEGVLPSAVLGHSLGEYAAVIIAGVLTLEESLTLVCARGKIIEANDACKGIMSAMRATEADALQAMKKLTPAVKRDVSVAAINGTMSIVLAGSERSVSALCAAMNISASVKLPVTHAFHSPLMKYAEQDFRKVLETVTFKPPRANMRFISTVRGREVSFDELKDPQYWIDHMVNSVRFADAIECAYVSANCRTIVEMGPLSVLSKLAQMQLKSKGAVWTGDKANCWITSCVES